MKKIFLYFSLVFILLGCTANQETPAAQEPQEPATTLPDFPSLNENSITNDIMKEKISIQTSDGVTIIGDFSSVADSTKGVLLLHMMPATRQSYDKLAEELNKYGFSTLAIDFRGHGESLRQGSDTLNYANFPDSEHQNYLLDANAALSFLNEKGVDEISVVGASIGANIALQEMSANPGIKRGVLLSPGMDYRGVRTEPLIKKLKPDQKVWAISSEEDKYSADTTLKLQQTRQDGTTMTIFGGDDHGTDMFSEISLIPDIVKFLQS